MLGQQLYRPYLASLVDNAECGFDQHKWRPAALFAPAGGRRCLPRCTMAGHGDASNGSGCVSLVGSSSNGLSGHLLRRAYD
jgi:hypothetical protein